MTRPSPAFTASPFIRSCATKPSLEEQEAEKTELQLVAHRHFVWWHFGMFSSALDTTTRTTRGRLVLNVLGVGWGGARRGCGRSMRARYASARAGRKLG
jgi:hypothetical protein